MNASNRGFRGRSGVSSQRRFTETPEDFGNRHGFSERKIPSDDVGNIIDNDPIATFVHDSLGNSIEGEPSHLRSGFLSNMGFREQNRSYRHEQKERPQPKERPKPVHKVESGEDYMNNLRLEFAKLIKNKSGMPFSFCMRPASGADENKESEYLSAIESLICDVLESSSIDAQVELALYATDNQAHRFAVFFVSSDEKDPVKNKDLISALRQVVNLYEKKHPYIINTMLVLSNAKSIIESHLEKVGASKI